MYQEFVSRVISEYVSTRMERRIENQKEKAAVHITEVEDLIGNPSKVAELTKQYESNTDNPTLLGWRRFCLMRGIQK